MWPEKFKKMKKTFGVHKTRRSCAMDPLAFKKCLNLYCCLRILTMAGNASCSNFVQTLITTGIIFSTCGGYTCIKLYGIMPPAFYFSASLVFPIVILIVFVMITLGSIHEENAITFRQAWRLYLFRKIDRKRLACCYHIGYSFGIVDKCKRKTALSITDVVINQVASLALQ